MRMNDRERDDAASRAYDEWRDSDVGASETAFAIFMAGWMAGYGKGFEDGEENESYARDHD